MKTEPLRPTRCFGTLAGMPEEMLVFCPLRNTLLSPFTGTTKLWVAVCFLPSSKHELWKTSSARTFEVASVAVSHWPVSLQAMPWSLLCVSTPNLSAIACRLFIMFFHKAFNGSERLQCASEIFDRAHKCLQEMPAVSLESLLLSEVVMAEEVEEPLVAAELQFQLEGSRARPLSIIGETQRSKARGPHWGVIGSLQLCLSVPPLCLWSLAWSSCRGGSGADNQRSAQCFSRERGQGT